ncbi:MAG: hypothetical protein WD688_23315 [Candidatus Binatia bacterium]
MKRFLSVLVASMFLASAAYAASKGEENKTDGKAKAEATKTDGKVKAEATKTDGKAKAKAKGKKSDAKMDENKTAK